MAIATKADGTGYPVRFDVDYPERQNRLTTFFRLFCAIPIFIVVATIVRGGAGILSFPVLLMLLFRRKYPAWWFDWNLELTKFEARTGAYLLLLRDEYPSTDEEQAVHLEIDAPDAGTLNRWLPLVKWLLAIPHYIVLIFLGIAVLVVTIIAWFAILFTGRYPRGMHTFVVGVGRWEYRVVAYAFILSTDKYPPFSLS